MRLNYRPATVILGQFVDNIIKSAMKVGNDINFHLSTHVNSNGNFFWLN